MLSGIVNAISQPGFQNLIQNTTAQVSIETGLKAVGRPLFTLADKHADKETKKYSATKELLYQILCLGIYLLVIPPIFKRGGFKIFQKLCNKIDGDKAGKGAEFLKEITKGKVSKCAVNEFKNEKGLLAMFKLSHMPVADRNDPKNKLAVNLLKTLKENLTDSKESEEILRKIKTLSKEDDYFRQFYIAKGGIEMSSIVGSVVGLTVLAPELSHLILHPIMKAIGMEKSKESAQTDISNKLDKQA